MVSNRIRANVLKHVVHAVARGLRDGFEPHSIIVFRRAARLSAPAFLRADIPPSMKQRHEKIMQSVQNLNARAFFFEKT